MKGGLADEATACNPTQPGPRPARPQLAVLFDTENIPAWCAAGVLTKLRTIGELVSVCAFGDFRRVETLAWSEACVRHDIIQRQVDRFAGDKNAVDIAITIAVMDVVHASAVDGVAVASNDTDFVPLASRLRAAGVSFLGFADALASDRLKDACTAFYPIELLAPESLSSTRDFDSQPFLKPSRVSRLLRALVADLRDETGWAEVIELEHALDQGYGGLDPRLYGFRDLDGLLLNLGFDLDVRGERALKARLRPGRSALRKKARKLAAKAAGSARTVAPELAETPINDADEPDRNQ